MADETQPSRRTCATMAVHHRLLRTVDGYAERCSANENHALRAQIAPAGRDGLHRDPGGRARGLQDRRSRTSPTRRSHSQIDVLNADFRKRNADVGERPGAVRAAGRRRPDRVRAGDADPTAARRRHHPHQTDATAFGTDDARQVRRHRRRRRLAARRLPQPLGLPARRRPARLRAVPGRPGGDRRRRHPAHRLRHDRHGGGARSTSAAPRPTRSATGSTCATSGATTAPAAAATTSSPTRPTRAARTTASRRSRTSAAATARTATCS